MVFLESHIRRLFYLAFLLPNFENHFQPYVFDVSGGKRFSVQLIENSGTSARPQVTNSEWIIKVESGLIKNPDLTADILALILCHELGHMAGGEPKERSRPGKYSYSFEGQADYYATSFCIRDFWKNENNKVNSSELPSEVFDKCSQKYSNPNEIELCLRSNLASYFWAVKFLLPAQRTDQIIPGERLSFLRPDPPRELADPYEAHPRAQCRLDTLYAGSLQAPRPACWFGSP